MPRKYCINNSDNLFIVPRHQKWYCFECEEFTEFKCMKHKFRNINITDPCNLAAFFPAFRELPEVQRRVDFYNSIPYGAIRTFCASHRIVQINGKWIYLINALTALKQLLYWQDVVPFCRHFRPSRMYFFNYFMHKVADYVMEKAARTYRIKFKLSEHRYIDIATYIYLDHFCDIYRFLIMTAVTQTKENKWTNMFAIGKRSGYMAVLWWGLKNSVDNWLVWSYPREILEKIIWTERGLAIPKEMRALYDLKRSQAEKLPIPRKLYEKVLSRLGPRMVASE